MSGFLLKGISWNHSRAYPPLVASAQRFGEISPHADIQWEKRSLHEFGHASLTDLCGRYDLIVVDHPMMGEAHKHDLLYDLRPLLPLDVLEEMSSDSAGPSYASYLFNEHLYGLPIDAATPCASYRPDLLERLDIAEPRSWDELLALARRGLVRMPGFPADLFLNFMGMCISRGAAIAASGDAFCDQAIAIECLELLRELASFMPEQTYDWNPIALYERMAGSDEFAYCPFAYTYSNYSRPGFVARPLRFCEPVSLPDGEPMRTVLGGTGIAISKQTKYLDTAVAFAQELQSSMWQRTIYALAGGQPARRSAWLDPTLNGLADGFFVRTLPAMECAAVRPRYAGYVPFQEKAGAPLVEYLREHHGLADRNGAAARSALDRLDAMYRDSLVVAE